MSPTPSNSPPGVTHALTTRPREVSFHRFRLQVVDGADRGLERTSDAAELVIGTAPGTDLTLTDRAASRHHCTITATPRGFLLRDLGSTNGTTLAGYRIESAYLKTGAVIGVGETSLRFDSLGDEVREPLSEDERYGRLLGRSAAMRRIFAIVPRIAASESTVLLQGETGTGKGLLAETIHQQSQRAAGPFVVLDCSSIPASLIEAELFGHTKGAFTGAHAARPGVFEAARGGTVFLDEIGELPLEMQPKLLRALEERVVRRVGSVESVRLDVRVIAATNRDLRQEVNRGAFRADLFYRLNVVKIHIPPLRERRDDILLLIAHFYEQFVASGDPCPPAELVESLLRQDWPGNVRELRSAVERAVLLDEPMGKDTARIDLPPPSQPAPPSQSAPVSPSAHAVSRPPPGDTEATDAEPFDASLSFRAAKEQAMARWERWYLRSLVRSNGGNLSGAARAARMDRNHLRELLRRHGISAREEA